jgi:hypothetical protein
MMIAMFRHRTRSWEGTLTAVAPASSWGSEAMLLLVAAVWGASYGLTKTAVMFYPVFGFLALRFCTASLLLRPKWRGLSKSQVRKTLATGAGQRQRGRHRQWRGPGHDDGDAIGWLNHAAADAAPFRLACM